MKKNLLCLALAGTAALLAGCSSLAKAQMQQVQLSSGSHAVIDQVAPTAQWQCHEVATPYSANWSKYKIEYQSFAHKVLYDHAIADANQKKVKANYIYIQIPNSVSILGIDTNLHQIAYGRFYQCKYINPDLKTGGERQVGLMPSPTGH